MNEPYHTRARYAGAQNAVIVGGIDLALSWADHIFNLDQGDPVVLNNVACIYSLAHDIDKGVESFRRAIESGFVNRKWLEMDPDLDPLRSSRSYPEILTSTQ